MLLTHGKHQGKHLEMIVLQDPAYALSLCTSPHHQLSQWGSPAEQMIYRLDRQPFLVGCELCHTRRAQGLAAFSRQPPFLWCYKCHGDETAYVVILLTYAEMVKKAHKYAGTASDAVHRMAHAAGLPKAYTLEDVSKLIVPPLLKR